MVSRSSSREPVSRKARGLFAFVASGVVPGVVPGGAPGGVPGVTRAIALGLCCIALAGGCRQAAFSLLPRAPMGPSRNSDPFAPLSPPAAARAPEGRAPTVSTAAGKVDVGVSSAALLDHFFSRGGFFFGVYGTFEENDVLRGKPEPARQPASSPTREPAGRNEAAEDARPAPAAERAPPQAP